MLNDVKVAAVQATWNCVFISLTIFPFLRRLSFVFVQWFLIINRPSDAYMRHHTWPFSIRKWLADNLLYKLIVNWALRIICIEIVSKTHQFTYTNEIGIIFCKTAYILTVCMCSLRPPKWDWYWFIAATNALWYFLAILQYCIASNIGANSCHDLAPNLMTCLLRWIP